jgi:hypothetical protein
MENAGFVTGFWVGAMLVLLFTAAGLASGRLK